MYIVASPSQRHGNTMSKRLADAILAAMPQAEYACGSRIDMRIHAEHHQVAAAHRKREDSGKDYTVHKTAWGVVWRRRRHVTSPRHTSIGGCHT